MDRCRRVEAGCSCYIATGGAFQNEAAYIKEWIEFYRMGVHCFVLVGAAAATTSERCRRRTWMWGGWIWSVCRDVQDDGIKRFASDLRTPVISERR
jgi:hypothetical protein